MQYVKMFDTQEFDLKEEKLNKFKRIDKLISAMPNDQQAIAQSLCFVHEMGSQQNRFALLHEHLQTLPHEVPRLRVKPCGGLI